jgi:predicted esterase
MLPLPPRPPPGAGPYYEWWNAQRGPDGAWAYQHADASLAFLQDVCRLHGPFDGAVGFSQGAAAAALLAGMQRAGAALDGQPPLKLLLLFAGIRVRDPALERYYASLAAVPSLHVIGDRDPVKSMTNRLIEAFDAPLVLSHPRGHVIPSLPPADLARLRAFLEAAAVDSAL